VPQELRISLLIRSFTLLPSTTILQCYKWSETGGRNDLWESSLFIQYYLFIPILMLFFSCSILLGTFLVTPSPMTVTRGSVSVFNCSADADAVSFRFNGTSVNVLDNPDIEVTISLPGMEPRLHMLHIVAKEEYNNTRVQCLATSFLSGPTFSNETVLIIQGKGSFYFGYHSLITSCAHAQQG